MNLSDLTPDNPVPVISLIYRSPSYADFVYRGVTQNSQLFAEGKAEFLFVANDPTDRLLAHLDARGYPYVVQRNETLSREEMIKRGLGWPEYMHGVYCGWNRALEEGAARHEIIVLVSSDMAGCTAWLENLLKNLTTNRVIVSRLVEPAVGKKLFPHELTVKRSFGLHPGEFNEEKFLAYCETIKEDKLVEEGPNTPVALYAEYVDRIGGFPEGNVLRSLPRWDARGMIPGDRVFFHRLRAAGIYRYTAMDSIAYHIKEGEQDEKLSPTPTAEISPLETDVSPSTVDASRTYE